MDKRTILGILIIFAIFLLSEQFIWKKAKPVPAQSKQQEQAKPAAPTPAPVQGKAQISPLLVSPDQKLPAINNNLILENDSLQLVFSNQGGVIRQVFLKKFLLSNKSRVQLIPAGKDLANTILLSDNSSTDLRSLPFDYEQISVKGQPGIRFFFTPEPDRTIEKTFVLEKNYSVKFNLKIHSVYGLTGYSIGMESGLNNTEETNRTKTMDWRFFTQIDNTLLRRDLRQLNKNSQVLNGKVDWAAVRSKYFVIACRDLEPVLTNSVKADTSSHSPAFTLTTKRDKAAVDWDEDYTMYFGPSDIKLLQTQGAGMENVAERGAKWLRWLVDIFSWFLKLLYKFIPNYGIVIILFSIVLKVILHPLTHKSMDSSLKMQRIQPQVQALQQQYKSDPKRMQMELSKLYKEAGASPLGGCLPLLLQMPVFFALYTVLRFSLDMRMAYFVGWLKDLSEPDPYYILPILMGIFMIVQQLMMNPKKQQLEQMDEKQKSMQQSQKMMAWIMPVVLFFVFKSMPAGLVLYWTVFNVLSIIQQYYLQKHLNKKEF